MNQLHVFLLSTIVIIGGIVSQLKGCEFVLTKGNAYVHLPNGFHLYVPKRNIAEVATINLEYFYHVEGRLYKVVANPQATVVTLYNDKEEIQLSLTSGEIDEELINPVDPLNGITLWNIEREKKSIKKFIPNSTQSNLLKEEVADTSSGEFSADNDVIHISATQPTEDDFLPPLDGRKSRYSHFTKTTPSYTFSDALVFFMVHAISKEIALHWLSHSGCSIKPIKYRSLHLINNQIAIAAAEGALWGGISVGSNSSSLTSSKVGDVILSALGNGAIALVQEWIRQPIEWYARKWCNNISLKTNQSSGGHYIAALLAKELLRQTIRSGLHIAVMMMVYGIHSYQCKIKMAHMGPWWDDKNVGINCAYYFFKKLGMVS